MVDFRRLPCVTAAKQTRDRDVPCRVSVPWCASSVCDKGEQAYRAIARPAGPGPGLEASRGLGCVRVSVYTQEVIGSGASPIAVRAS